MARTSYYGDGFSEYLHSKDTVTEPENEVFGQRPAYVLGDTEWMEDGLCQQVDPEIFFPDGEGGNGYKGFDTARKICRKCPVKEACLEYALTAQVTSINGYDLQYVSGIWAGTTMNQRNKIRTRRGIPNHIPSTRYENDASLNVYTEGGD